MTDRSNLNDIPSSAVPIHLFSEEERAQYRQTETPNALFERWGVPLAAKTQDVRIMREDGSVVFAQNNVVAPATWSDLAVRIAAQKYLIKRGIMVDGAPIGQETDCFMMLKGVADTIANAGLRYGYFKDVEEAGLFGARLYGRQVQQHGAFNSPVYFNVRHWFCYQIPGGSGNYAWDFQTLSPEVQDKNYQRPQSSACFILGVEDSLCGPDGITDSLKAEAKIFKYGSGAGANFSRLREKGGRLNVGGTSSGVISFLRVFDEQAGAIKSAGTTRRAAKMVILDDDHPDMPEFVQWKVKEEAKARALVAAGYSGDLDGEAYQSVSGQNANNSVRVSNAFMRAVEDDDIWALRSRVDGAIVATHPARKLFREMMEAAHACGDPGLQFHDTINRWHTTPGEGPIRGSNPCSEYLSIDDSACNLASLRLTKFLNPDGVFDFDDFRAAIRVFFLAQEILVDLASYPTEKICDNAHRHRQLGLGYCDLSALLLRLGLGYDTQEGRMVAGAITSFFTACAYEMSADIAARMNPCTVYEQNKASVLRVLQQHAEETSRAREKFHWHFMWTRAMQAWDVALEKARKHGIRNMQATLLAPTGTISFLMDATTTGVEPLLALVQEKKLVGGGTAILENAELSDALTSLGYTPEQRERILAHVRQTGKLRGAPGFQVTDERVFATALGANSLSPEAHVLMLAAVQPFLSGAISKTVNLPSSATVEDFERMAVLAWKEGVKCLALYRDGSKGVQPVRAKENAEVPQETPAVSPPAQPTPPTPPTSSVRSQNKLPSVRRGITWAATLEGHKIYIRSGEYPDGRLGEVFVDISQDGSTLGGLMGSWARSLSIGLQYGVPLEEYVKSHLYTRFEPHGMVGKHPSIRFATSLTDLVIRVLAVHYLGRTDLQHVQLPNEVPVQPDLPTSVVSPSEPRGNEEANSGPLCPICGAMTTRNATCFRCTNCGESLGCS